MTGIKFKERNSHMDIVHGLEDVLFRNVNDVDFREVLAFVARQSEERQRELLTLCKRALYNAEYRKAENLRIAAVRLLVALAPRSAECIEGLFRNMEGEDIYEVHFTLLCYLEWLPLIAGAEELADNVPGMLAKYLADIEVDTADAAWMAGDLLGEYWELGESLDVLLAAAEFARHPAGQEGALYGLRHALGRLGDRERIDEVMETLRRIAGEDEDPEIRSRAASLVHEYIATLHRDWFGRRK
jgi:hypothetical protein